MDTEEDPRNRLRDHAIDIDLLPEGEKEKLWFLYKRAHTEKPRKANLLWPAILALLSFQWLSDFW
jgi:hypothetical protein